MKTIQISLTDEQYAAVIKAQLHHDLALEGTADESSQVGTPEAYVQKVMDGAAASYAVQWADNTIEGLQNQLAIANDGQARAIAQATEAQRKREEAESKAEQLAGEKAQLQAALDSKPLAQQLEDAK